MSLWTRRPTIGPGCAIGRAGNDWRDRPAGDRAATARPARAGTGGGDGRIGGRDRDESAAMVEATHDAVAEAPPAEIDDVELPHARSWWTRYVFCQDAKVIAIQYTITADRDRAGRPRPVVADAPAARLPRHSLDHQRGAVLPVHHHARHDHGRVSVDRVVPGRLRQLPDTAHGRRAGHGVPVRQHAELLGLPARCRHTRGQFLRPRRPDRRRLDPLSAAVGALRHPLERAGDRPDAGLADRLHRRLHDGRSQLRGHGAAVAGPRHDDDAPTAPTSCSSASSIRSRGWSSRAW